MKTLHILTGLSLLSGLSVALPTAPADDPDPGRILPHGWEFKITSLKGPGCPDFGIADGADRQRHTRTTFGMNTVDGSEIYYWFLGYPYMRVELGKTESVWCETEVEYVEYRDGQLNTASDYRIRLHKNGTKVIGVFDMDPGVTAKLSWTYVDFDVTDELTLDGPYRSEKGYWPELDLTGPQAGSPYKVDQCGASKLRFRTELSISGIEGNKGIVQSEPAYFTDVNPPVQSYYGTQLGFSFDWEKCS